MSKTSPRNLASKAVEDRKLLSELLVGILSKKHSTRQNSFKALSLLSEGHPKVLYPSWDYFADLNKSGESGSKYIALHIIANLTRADSENKFDGLFDEYYELLNDDSVVIAAHLAGNSGKIAKVKPELQTRITDRLLSIDETQHTPEHKNLIKSYAVESLDEYFEEAKDKEKVIEFVKMQVGNKSPRTRKKAKEFLKKMGK
jgi:hypothetical protein